MSKLPFSQEQLDSFVWPKMAATNAIHLEVAAGRMTKEEAETAISKFKNTVSLRQYGLSLIFATKDRK